MSVQTKFHRTEAQLTKEYDEVEKAKADPASFEVLYTRYHEQIFRFIYQRVDSKDTAFDITSQVFLKAMLNLGNYKNKGVPFSSWLYRIASNLVKDNYRKTNAQRTINIDTANISDIVEEIEENPLLKYQEAMMNAIASLPEPDLQLIEMRYFEKRPFKEIAEILEITENNAKVKVYRLLDRLKKVLTSKNQ